MIDPTPIAPELKSTVQQMGQRLGYIWNRLTVPAAIIQDPERRQQARLLSSLLLALIVAITLILIIRTIGGVLWQDLTTLAAGGAIAILIAIYSLSRTRHYIASATLTVAALFALVHTAPLWADRMDHALFYATLPILLSSILLSLPAMLAVAGISLGNMLLLVLISAQGSALYLAPFSHTLITTAILVTFIYHRDRIERERQAALRASENNHRLLLEQASDGIFITDPAGNFLMVNSKGREMVGASTGDLVRLNLKDCLLSADLTRTPLPWDDLSAGRTIIAEGHLRGQNAQLIPVEVSIKRLDDGRLQAIVRDSTERKRAEAALRQSEARFAKVFQASPSAIVLSVPATGRFLDANDSYLRLVGYRREEIIDHTSLELGIWANPLERAWLVEAVYEHGAVQDMEITVRQKSGQIRHALNSAELIDLDGQPCLIGMLYDITERKQAEEVLRAQEERYRIITELMSDYAYAYRVETDGTFIGEWDTVDSFKRITGYATEEIGTTFGLYHPDDQERAKGDVKAVIAGNPGEGEYRILTKRGDLRWMHISRRPVWDPQQKRVVRFYGIAQDITERKQAEEALRLTNLAVENSSAIIFRWRYDMAAGWPVEFVSRNVSQLGYTPEELLAINVPYTSLMVPEDVEPTDREIEAYFVQSIDRYRLEYRLITKAGQVRWVEDRTVVERDAEGQVIYTQGLILDITERKQAEKALRASEERYRSLFEDSPNPVSEQDFSAVKASIKKLQGQGVNDFRTYFERHPEVVADCAALVKITNINKATLALFQANSKDELMRGLPQLFDQKSYEAFKDVLIALAQGKTRFEQETINRTLNGDPKHLVLSWSVVPGYEETFSNVLVSVVDMTERKLLEEQLRQAQKLEAIGRLAGGIAHDFNNILTVIKGYTGLLLQDLDAHNPLTADIGQIAKSAERAAALIRQLLAFSRKQVLQPQPLDLNNLVVEVEKMLRRLIGEDIELITLLGSELEQVKADPGQLEQVILNLATNARDAMPQGGKLTIETKNIYLDKTFARRHVGVKAGPYIMLAMSDTGSGMDQETRSHIFEPFFTTKDQGQGTGLGLATVHGIVTQSGGHIGVYSEPGQGTTFKVYLPRTEEPASSAKPKLQRPRLPKPGSETVLLVEDEPLVREFARRTLLNEGYNVLEASHGAEAIRVAQQYLGLIDLLITDIVMPGGMSGRQVVERLTLLRREMKVLYISGYMDDALVRHGIFEADVAFLQKPFSPDRLAGKVREVLDMPQGKQQ